jgi:predicted RNA binding protein YcfA (HicA-like mRNA interferase family)
VQGNRDLPTGTLRAILRQSDLTPDELTDLL